MPVLPPEAELTGYSITLLPRWPITERISVFGKLGLLDWKASLTKSFAGQVVERPSDTDLLTGLGAEITFGGKLGVLAEIERTDLLEALSVGARWRF